MDRQREMLESAKQRNGAARNLHADLDALSLEALSVEFVDASHDVSGVSWLARRVRVIRGSRNNALVDVPRWFESAERVDGLDDIHYVESLDVVSIPQRD